MRSPYRLVPLLVAALIVGVAVYQATRPAQRASAAEVAAAKALKGKCLARDGGPGSGTYSATPVACGSTSAAMKVVAVIVPGGGGAGFAASQCPRGSVAAQVLKPGVTGEPVECLEPVPS
jgi:hypothetical protein